MSVLQISTIKVAGPNMEFAMGKSRVYTEMMNSFSRNIVGINGRDKATAHWMEHPQTEKRFKLTGTSNIVAIILM